MSYRSEQFIDSLVMNSINDDDKIKTLFDFVKSKVSYIDFENGIGAVQPRDVNKILNMRLGDCKDMSNLLCQSLRYLGFDAQLAISATNTYSYNLEFPSIAAANHVICVVPRNNQLVYLDATSSSCIYGYPSTHLQDKNILVIDDDSTYLEIVPKVPLHKNKSTYTCQLKLNQNELTGFFNYKMHGLSQMSIRHLKNSVGESLFAAYQKNYLEHFAPKINHHDIQLLQTDTTILLNGKVTIEKMRFSAGYKKIHFHGSAAISS